MREVGGNVVDSINSCRMALFPCCCCLAQPAVFFFASVAHPKCARLATPDDERFRHLVLWIVTIFVMAIASRKYNCPISAKKNT